MKGIREIAMGSPEPEKDPYESKYAKPYSGSGSKSMFDDELYDNAPYSGYGSRYDPYDSYNPKKKTFLPDVTPKGQMQITMSFTFSEIGDYADENHPAYNWGRAIDKATELAYDQIEKLAGKGYESRYNCDFKVSEGFLEYEAVVTLTPLK